VSFGLRRTWSPSASGTSITTTSRPASAFASRRPSRRRTASYASLSGWSPGRARAAHRDRRSRGPEQRAVRRDRRTAEAYLVREARLLTLPEPDPASGLPSEDGADPEVWHGDLLCGDSIILISPNATRRIGLAPIQDAVIQLHPQVAIDQIYASWPAAVSVWQVVMA